MMLDTHTTMGVMTDYADEGDDCTQTSHSTRDTAPTAPTARTVRTDPTDYTGRMRYVGGHEAYPAPIESECSKRSKTAMLALASTVFLVLTIVATAIIYRLLPSWHVALWVVLGASIINFAVPESDFATLVAPAHLAGSTYLVAYMLQTYGRMSPGSSTVGAIVLLCLLSIAVAKLEPKDRAGKRRFNWRDDDDDEEDEDP